MKALTYHGPHHVQVENVPDPGIEQADDIILRSYGNGDLCSDSIFIEAKYPRLNMAIFLVMNLWGKSLKPERT
mgnify:CR=1 FL=1